MAASDINPVFAAWGAIQQAVGERASTADIWGALRSVLSPNGEPLPQGSFQAVNTMRSLAAGIRNAAETLASAPGDYAITGDMVSQNINSRDALQQSLSPSYEIRYQATITSELGESVQWFTAHVSSLAGMTKGDIVSALAFNNTALSEDYGADVSGVDNISISSV